MRLVVTLIASAALLTACGAEDEGAGKGGRAAESSAPAKRTLKDICPEVEVAVVANQDATDPAGLLSALTGLLDSADLEATNALNLLIDAARASDTSTLAPGDVEGVVDAQKALTSGLNTFADRCAAVGSSALQ